MRDPEAGAAGALRLPRHRLPPGHGRCPTRTESDADDRRPPRRVADAGGRQVPPAPGVDAGAAERWRGRACRRTSSATGTRRARRRRSATRSSPARRPGPPIPRRAAAERAAAALLRPGAALVPRPAGAAALGLQHAQRPAPDRRAGRRRPGRAPWPRWCGATTVLRTTFARDAEAGRAGRRARPSRRRCRSSISRRSTPAGARPRRGGWSRREAARAVRPAARPAAARAAAAPGAGGARGRARRCTTSSATAGRWACWSRELAALYAAFVQGRPSPLPELPIQYARLRPSGSASWLHGEVLEPQLAYWRERLARRAAARAADRPAAAAGADLPRRSPCRSLCRRTSRRPSPPSAGASGRPLFMTLLAGFAALLAPLLRPGRRRRRHAARQPRPRRDRGADRLLRQHPGRCASTLAASPASATCWRGCARRAVGAFAHQDLPFEQAGRGAAAGARPRPLAAVPGDVHAAERAAGDSRAAAASPSPPLAASRPRRPSST